MDEFSKLAHAIKSQGSLSLPGKAGYPICVLRVSLVNGLTFPLVNTSGRANPSTRVTFLLFFSHFECNRALTVAPGCRATLPVNFACKPGLSLALHLSKG